MLEEEEDIECLSVNELLTKFAEMFYSATPDIEPLIGIAEELKRRALYSIT